MNILTYMPAETDYQLKPYTGQPVQKPAGAGSDFQTLISLLVTEPGPGDARGAGASLGVDGQTITGDCLVDQMALLEMLTNAGYGRQEAQQAMDLAATAQGGVDPQLLDHYLGLAGQQPAAQSAPPVWSLG